MNDTLKKYDKLLSLGHILNNRIYAQSFYRLNTSIKFLNAFSDTYYRELKKLPYHFNLIDELKANENAHSRILAKLLQHPPTLYSFIQFLNDSAYGDLEKTSTKKFFFDKLLFNSPKVTAETMRIDVLVRESNKYAIIIENKIHDATEQPNQIARYIEKCVQQGINVSNIYILYLTRTELDQPSLQTWGMYNPEEFNGRFCLISYKMTIRDWLKKYQKYISQTEIGFQSAVRQYIEHLDHKLDKPEKNIQMEKNLRQFFEKKLNFTHDQLENVRLIDERIKMLTELKLHLDELSRHAKKSVFKDWRQKLEADYGSDRVIYNADSHFIKTGVRFDYKGSPFLVLIEYNYSSVYIGIGRHFSTEKLNSDISSFFEPIRASRGMKIESPWWYAWNYTMFETGYIDLKDLINEVDDFLSMSKVI